MADGLKKIKKVSKENAIYTNIDTSGNVFIFL